MVAWSHEGRDSGILVGGSAGVEGSVCGSSNGIMMGL